MVFKNCSQYVNYTWPYNDCFRNWGVNGTICSILIYLSEVEDWCPTLPGRFGPPTKSSLAKEPKERPPVSFYLFPPTTSALVIVKKA